MKHKVAIITAASRGMGAACAKELAKNNYHVVLMSTTDSIMALADELGGKGLVGNVTNSDDLQNLVDLTVKSYGQLDAVVNNTGHPPKGELLEITDADWRQAFDLLLMNVVRMCRLVVPLMQMQKNGGSIINISSFSAEEPNLDFPTSSTIRAGLSAYVKLFADKYGKDGIRMNNLLPGFVDSYHVSDEIRSAIPLGREAAVSEIAKTVAFLLSEEASYITGQNIRADGGLGRSM